MLKRLLKLRGEGVRYIIPKISVETDKVGSRVEKTIEIPDEEIENWQDERSKNKFIEEWCFDEMLALISWDYKEV